MLQLVHQATISDLVWIRVKRAASKVAGQKHPPLLPRRWSLPVAKRGEKTASFPSVPSVPSRASSVSPDSLAVGLQLGVGPLHGLQQATLLGVLDHCFVAKVVLVPRLDAEGTLRPHATHRLLNVHCPDVLQTRETNV